MKKFINMLLIPIMISVMFGSGATACKSTDNYVEPQGHHAIFKSYDSKSLTLTVVTDCKKEVKLSFYIEKGDVKDFKGYDYFIGVDEELVIYDGSDILELD